MTNSSRRARAVIACVAALFVVAPSMPGVGAAGETFAPPVESALFPEVGRLPLFGESLSDSEVARSGWLILNPTTRRGYQVFESFSDLGQTELQSFDLDTLAPLRRVRLRGVPITAGAGDAANPSATMAAGEVVHAVDEEAGRLYLAMGLFIGLPTGILNPDAQRIFTHMVMIDEAAFDRGDPAFAAAFGLPPSLARLQGHWLVGLKATRYGIASSSVVTPAKLLAVFASPTMPVIVPPGTVLPGLFDHQLVQLDPSALEPRAGDEAVPAAQPLVDPRAWAHHLTGCATASMTTQGSGPSDGNRQWEVLATADAVYVACQSAPGAAAVVRVALIRDPLGNPTAAVVGGEDMFPLSQRISDVLADDGGGHLLVRVVIPDGASVGQTWWVFDTRAHRWAGSVAALQYTGIRMGAGLDTTTGRLYVLAPDHLASDGRGSLTPVRGGFQVADTRLDPVPQLQNAVPSLKYPGLLAIRVDPVTRRVFVRRGAGATSVTAEYPSTDTTAPAPIEPFYRVLQDRVPVTQQPPEIDDSGFTTDVEESALTKASYLGQGSGYGARVVLTGGLRALTNGSDAWSPRCGRDDRELSAGSVGGVSVSDQSLVAEAASLDSDSGTKKISGDVVDACRRVEQPVPDRAENDTRELDFDADDDGVDDHAADCTGEGEGEAHVERTVPRDGFVARVRCAPAEERAEASASASLEWGPAAEAGVRVGHASSTVTVTRKAGSGVVVKVDSVARDVELPGVGRIGVVRAETTSVATGRSRGDGASAGFTRTICGVQLPDFVRSGCLPEDQQRDLVEVLNDQLTGMARVRLREPDDVLAAGSASGFRSGLQRHRHDRFADRVIDRDLSLAVPALELVFYQGDGTVGPARQIVQLAAVQAGTSYGIACLYGQRPDGKCAKEGEGFGTLGDGGDDDLSSAGGSSSSGPGEPIVTTITETLPGETAAAPVLGTPRERLLTRLLRAPFRAAAEALRLLFNNPRELGLLAAVWALLYAPCYLGARRRDARGIRARRAALRGVA